MKITLIPVLTILFAFTAHSSTQIWGPGASVAPEKNEPGVCFIRVTLSDDSEQVCSGTLIAPDKIITAAHCFGRYYSFTYNSLDVRCGGRYIGSADSVSLPDDELWMNDTRPVSARDVAQITLSRPARKATPVTPGREYSEFFEETGTLKSGTECKVVGFGADRYGNPGTMRVWNLSMEKVEYLGDVIMVTSRDPGYLATSADHGDSGGPLLCRSPGGEWKQIGVTGGYRFDQRDENRTANFFAPIWSNLP